MVRMASISSVSFIVPICAAKALPERPATMIAVISTPSSRKVMRPTRFTVSVSAPNCASCTAPCWAMTMPMRKLINPTIGSADTPTSSSWRTKRLVGEATRVADQAADGEDQCAEETDDAVDALARIADHHAHALGHAGQHTFARGGDVGVEAEPGDRVHQPFRALGSPGDLRPRAFGHAVGTATRPPVSISVIPDRSTREQEAVDSLDLPLDRADRGDEPRAGQRQNGAIALSLFQLERCKPLHTDVAMRQISGRRQAIARTIAAGICAYVALRHAHWQRAPR